MKAPVALLLAVVLLFAGTVTNTFVAVAALNDASAARHEIRAETGARIQGNTDSLRDACVRQNESDAKLKHVIEIATEGYPPGLSKRLDDLRAEGEAITPEDCSKIP